MNQTTGKATALALLFLSWAVAVADGQDQGCGGERMLAVGNRAPDFSLPCATKDSICSEEFRLSSIFGSSRIILAFYHADWSGGCTKEVCMFRDNISSLSSFNVQVLAVSGDYVHSHHEWAKHLSLPFYLLSDHSHSVAKSYQTYNPSTRFNRRTVYVIDARGIIFRSGVPG